MGKLYPSSGVEVRGLVARFYDQIMDTASLGFYPRFIRSAVDKMNICPEDRILDLGCGTGRNSLLMHRRLGEKGEVIGVDISPVMERHFMKNTLGVPRVSFLHQRIDVPFTLEHPFDRVLISFVIHGFPHENRLQIIENIHRNLKPGGSLFLLDYAEFSLAGMPASHRFLFKFIECEYAFDHIKRDWKHILQDHGFEGFEEHFWLKNYVRLLEASKK